jgi:hypothetical protein
VWTGGTSCASPIVHGVSEKMHWVLSFEDCHRKYHANDHMAYTVGLCRTRNKQLRNWTFILLGYPVGLMISASVSNLGGPIYSLWNTLLVSIVTNA